MANINKRPIVSQDLITHATNISLENLDASDRFLYSAEATFNVIAQFPAIGRLSNFSHPQLTQIRQYQIKGFTKYIIFYQIQSPETIEIMRILHGAQDLEFILTSEE
ncbi:MAG: type II toxin-antitoxin system RelE/ParE family toxin [Pseudanabaena sp.]|nr:MAG: type II toxin-antitoxin system RelE/ParE family toxin [Pseudanabaena sp.]